MAMRIAHCDIPETSLAETRELDLAHRRELEREIDERAAVPRTAGGSAPFLKRTAAAHSAKPAPANFRGSEHKRAGVIPKPEPGREVELSLSLRRIRRSLG
jgi:hypothetical protein